MTNSKKRSIKRIVALLLALSLVMTPALAYATEFESIYFEPGQVCPYDEEREARIAELLEELEMIDEKLEELREQREVYLSKIALLTEQKRELQKRIDELRDDSEYYPDYYSEVEADQETYEPEPENTSPELPAERQPIDRPSNGGAVENGRPNDAASNESNTRQPAYETPVNNVPENNQPAEEAPANGAPIVEYSPRVLEMMREHQLFLEQQGIEPEAPAVNNTPASDDSSIIVSVLHFFATPVHAFEGDYDYEFDYEPGYADLSGTSDLADFSNILDQLDENASLEELESALADVVEKLEQYTNALYALEAEIAYLEELREAVAAELDALVMGIMAFGIDATASNWQELVDAIQAAPTTAPDNLVPHVIQLTADITDAPANTIVVNIDDGRNVQIIGDYEIHGSGTNVVSVWGNNAGQSSILTLGGLGEPGPTIMGGTNSGVRVGWSGGTLIMYSGTIRDNSSSVGGFGGGVFLADNHNARFYMHGGTIEHNTARQINPPPSSVHGGSGGGVFVGIGANFYLHGGHIQYNESQHRSGGGILVNAGTTSAAAAGGRLVMDGGVIHGNWTADSYYRIGGGGITVGLPGTHGASFYMHSGSIQYNHSGAQGGGVTIHGNSNGINTFTMTGGTIRKNTARVNGGGVCVWGTFVMHGGLIDDNTALGDWTPLETRDIVGVGGGVFVGQDLGRFHMHHGAVISNNTALKGGGIGLSAIDVPPHFYMHGGKIINNTARPVGDPFIGIAPVNPNTGLPNDTYPNIYPAYITTGHGGAIYMRGAPRVYIGKSSCYLCGSITTPPPLIDDNTAAGNGGAIKVRDIRVLENHNPPFIGRLEIRSGTLSNNVANNGGAIYSNLANVWDQPARDMYVTSAVIFTRNYARNGLFINNKIADLNAGVIRPGVRTIYRHAFTNHDIFVPTRWEITIIKSSVDPPPIILPGDTITYRISIINSYEPTTSILVRDPLSDYLTFVPGSLSFNPPNLPVQNWLHLPPTMIPDFCEQDAIDYNVIEVYFPIMESDFFINIYFKVTVEEGATSPIMNTATVFHYRGYSYSQVALVSPRIEKDADPEIVKVGEIITYTLRILHDDGDDDTLTLNNIPAGLVVGDDLDLSFVEWVGNVRINGVSITQQGGNPNQYTFTGGAFRATLPEIPVGGYVEVTFDVKALEDAAENDLRALNPQGSFYGVRNVAFIVNPCEDGDNIKSNHVDVEVLPIVPVTLEKEADRDTAAVGDIIEYTLTLTNRNELALNNFLLRDTLPTELAFADPVNVTINGTPVAVPVYEIIGQEFSMVINIPAAVGDVYGEVVVTFEARVLAAAAGSTVTNDAELLGPPASGEYEDVWCDDAGDYVTKYVPGNRPIVDEDAVEVDIDPIVPLELKKTANRSSAVVGDIIKYTLTVRNLNEVAFNNFLLIDTLPAGLEFADPVNVTINGTPVAVPVYEIIGQEFSMVIDIPAATATDYGLVVVTFEARVLAAAAGSTVTNDAELLGPPAPGEYEDVWCDDADDYVKKYVPGERPPVADDSVSVPIDGAQQPPTPNVSIIKTASQDVAQYDEEFYYTITVSNTGTAPATNVVVTDLLPDGLTFVGSSSNTTGVNLVFDSSTRELTADVGTLAVNQTIVFTIIVTVAIEVDVETELKNVATVDGDNFDKEYDEATVNILPENAARLELSKVANDPERERRLGQYVTYTFTVKNVGGEDAYDIRVFDELPAGLQFVSYTAPVGAEFEICADNRDIEVTYVGPLAPNETLTFTVTTRVTINSGTIVNDARVYLGETLHDNDRATITVRRPGGGGNGYTPQPPGPGQNIPDPDPPVGQYPQDPHDPPYEIEPPRTPLDPGPDRPGDQPPTGDVPRTGATGGSAGLMLLSLLALIALAAIGRKRETDGLAHKKI